MNFLVKFSIISLPNHLFAKENPTMPKLWSYDSDGNVTEMVGTAGCGGCGGGYGEGTCIDWGGGVGIDCGKGVNLGEGEVIEVSLGGIVILGGCEV